MRSIPGKTADPLKAIKLAALLLFFTLPLGAELPRIATVDMARVFEQLEEKQQAEATYHEALADLSQSSRVQAVEEMDAELTRLAETIRDQSLAENRREEAAARFSSLSTEYTSLVTEMERHLTSERKKLTRQFVEKQEAIIAKARAITGQVAKRNNYDLVLEVGGKTSSQVSPIIYLSPATDITAKVSRQLDAKSGESTPSTN